MLVKWQKTAVADGGSVGEPGQLPHDLEGLAEGSLADLGWTAEELGYHGFGFVAVIDLVAAKVEKRADLTRRRDAVLAGGWSHDFGADGVHTLDLRNADDKANWTLLLIKTQGMIAASAGAAPITIRTAANVSIVVTATEANAAMVAFLGWGEAVLAHKWALDEQIDAAADTAALAAVDIEAGWPS